MRDSKSSWESIILVMFTHLVFRFCGRGPYDDRCSYVIDRSLFALVAMIVLGFVFTCHDPGLCRHLSSDNMCIYVFDVFRD